MRALLYSCLVLAALGIPTLAQQPQHQDVQKPSAVSVERLIEQLGDPSYVVRRDAEKALASMGKDALKHLREAAKDHPSAEVRLRAGRLVERIGNEGGDASSEKLKPLSPLRELPKGWLDGDLDRMFGSLFDRLERDFGVDVPRGRFFDDPFFGDLRDQMEEMRRRLEGAGSDLNDVAESRALRMSITPQGVEVVIEEKDANGELQKRTYSAPDLETFREKYPEVAREYMDGDGDEPALRFAPRRFFNGGLPRLHEPDRSTERGAKPEGPVLGILARPVGEELRAFLGLTEGRGLLVESVTPGSLAARLGIKPHDVVLAIGETSIRGAADVPVALRAAGKTVEVTVNRRGKEVKLEAANSGAASDGKAADK